MLFQRVLPRGSAVSPEQQYTGLALGDRAGSQRPYVVCNFVSSVDGRATVGGRTAPLGGPGDRAAFHLLRTQVDAVLAGTGTLRIERYGVPVREEELSRIRVDEGRAGQPWAVVISRSGDVPFDIPMFSDARSRVLLYGPGTIDVPDCAATVTRHRLPAGPNELPEVLRSLRQEHDVRSLLCEGGPALFNALLVDDLVDELFLTLSPMLVGGPELGMTTGPPLAEVRPLRLVWALEHEGHLFLRYARARVEATR
jgi:riboflavin biosynthesis pyrimidine reductase